MKKPAYSLDQDMWNIIEKEKRRDRIIRWICIVAWSVTFAIIVWYAVMVGKEIAHTMTRFQIGLVHQREVSQALMPLIAVVGMVSLLIATLSTVGVFLRFRTTSLSEIQLRLAALEEMLSPEPDADDGKES